MAKQITVNTGTLKSRSQELKNLNNSLKTQLGELKATEQSLNSMWEGEAKNAFHTVFGKDMEQMNQFYTAIEQYITRLNVIVTKYEAAEQRNVSTANTRTC